MGLRRLITEFYGHLLAPSSDAESYHIVSKLLVKRNQTSPNSMGLRRLITEFYGHLPAPSSDADYHIVSGTRQDESNEPKLDRGCVVLITELLYGHLQLHHHADTI
ncbi:hypothetical protein EVAR_96650_1 [Eumeta japonica]|uniref:Uncharacterized protein n=1 Tax=Eumeta variegata TaxID=151549 RepID=A0A4C2A579_EUMVA|nr:hypothetical protein EVAR_96650_1 [Eumeta japonica]